MAINASLSKCEKCFYSAEFHVLFKFHKNGGLNGQLELFPGLNIKEEFTGLYLTEGDKTKVIFFLAHKNPNLTGELLTSFTGEIINYENTSRCLILRSLSINEPEIALKMPLLNEAIHILFDKPVGDHIQETRKIINCQLTDFFK